MGNRNRHSKGNRRFVQGLQGRQPTKGNSLSSIHNSNLDRNDKDSSNEAVEDNLHKYNAEASRTRMEEHGFSPQVTNKSVEEIMSTWSGIAAQSLTLSTSNLRSDIGKQCWEQYKTTVNHTMGFPFVRPARLTANWLKKAKAKPSNKSHMKEPALIRVLNSVDIGPLILKELSIRGHSAVHNLALANSKCWKAVSFNTNTWNSVTGKFEHTGYAKVLIVTCPDYAIGELKSNSGNRRFTPAWQSKIIAMEKELIELVKVAHRCSVGQQDVKMSAAVRKRMAKKNRKAILPAGFEPFVTQQPMSWIRDVKVLQQVGQFSKHASPWTCLRPRFSFAGLRLRTMLETIFEQKNSISVLNFQRTPLLDRRLLAIILRTCTNVVKLGVYDCPMIHFGDVLPMLDLIYEVNQSRKEHNQPEIEAFDFFPRFYDGSGAHSKDGLAYGLFSRPLGLGLVQRGLYSILLKAFTKSNEMNLGCLFDVDCAFRSYLMRVPNPPLSIPCFLDGLHRYIRAIKAKRRNSFKMRALYDILKPVRLGLDPHMASDWPNWYKKQTEQQLAFCSSCGYKMPEEFYLPPAEEIGANYLVCCGCQLQRYLDRETADNRVESVAAIDELCPGWSKYVFNVDAPIPSFFSSILRLHSTNSRRMDLPSAALHADGTIQVVHQTPPLARNNKIHHDSLQNLPHLEFLLDQKQATLWTKFNHSCKQIDLFNIVQEALGHQGRDRWSRQGELPGKLFMDRPKQMFTDEELKDVPAFNFFTASEFLRKGLQEKDW